jgi:hypothetical protein
VERAAEKLKKELRVNYKMVRFLTPDFPAISLTHRPLPAKALRRLSFSML